MSELYERLNSLSEAQQAFILSGVFSCLESDDSKEKIFDYIERKVNFFEEANHEPVKSPKR